MLVGFRENSFHNKFGYYSVGEIKTYSKYEAYLLSDRLGDPVRFHFNDLEMSSIDWTIEPSLSLTELYRQRAIQLREKYDHICLFYSGGADSHNILMSFVKNNIHIDEVVHYVTGDKESKDSTANGEIYHVAIPTIKKLDKPIKQTMIDVGKMVEKIGSIIQPEEWAYYHRTHLSPYTVARSLMRDDPHFQRLFDQGKKVCFLWGVDKPNLVGLENSRTGHYTYGVAFSDRGDYINDRQKTNNRSWEYDEYFYWSPDLPELVCKQSHLLKRFLDSVDITQMKSLQDKLKPRQLGGSSGVNWDMGYKKDGNTLIPLGTDIGHSIIYPWWDNNTLSLGKSRSFVFSDKDAWLWNNPDLQTVKTHRAAVLELQKSSAWAGVKYGLKTCWGPVYPMEKIDLSQYQVVLPY